MAKIKNFKEVFFLIGGLFIFFNLNFVIADDKNEEEIKNESGLEDDIEKIDLAISEVMYYFKNEDNKTEKNGQWIEVINLGDDFKLEAVGTYKEKFKYDLKVCDRESDKCENDDHLIYYDEDKLEIRKDEIFIIARDKEYFKDNHSEYKGKILESKFSLTSTKKPNFIGLFYFLEESESEEIKIKWLDKLEYEKDWGGAGNGKTIECKDEQENNKESNWEESVLWGGTPGKKYEKIEIEYDDQIRINELLPNPKGSDTDGEFIELWNFSDEVIDLLGWSVEDESNKNYLLNVEIDANEYLVIEYKDSKISLNNSGDKIKLLNPAGEEVDKTEYEKSEEGFSWARNKNNKFEWTMEITAGKENVFPEPKKYLSKIYINELLPNPSGSDNDNEWIEIFNDENEDIELAGWFLKDESGKKFYFKDQEIKKKDFLVISRKESGISLNNQEESLALYNPNDELVSKIEYSGSIKENYAYARKKNGKYDWTKLLTPDVENEFLEDLEFPEGVLINEILSDAEGADKNNEWIEFYNQNEKEIDLNDWYIENSSGKKYELKDFVISPKEYKVLKLLDTSFSIKNSKEKINFFNPRGDKIQEVDLTEKTGSGVSLNKDENSQWRRSRFLTPGEKNRFNQIPVFKIDKPKKVYKDIKASFELKNVKDADKDELKFKWDFGDGHYSYQEDTSHVFEKIGKYEIILRVFDGSEYIYEKFDIEVEKYPELEVKIIEIMPNPIGEDSEGEYIILKNNSSKKIDLSGWKIATGKDEKSLINHPIYEEIIIGSGKTIKIRRKDSKFSLLNKKGIVALKYPNDKISDIIKYEKDKILENERYILVNNKWVWQGVEDTKGNFNKNFQMSLSAITYKIKLVDLWNKVCHNKKSKITDNFEKIKFDNWRERNLVWVELSGLKY